MKRASLQSLPVVMNHYVNDSGWRMTLSPACFDAQCRVLAERGWRGVSLAEAEGYLLEGEPLPPRSLLFTFDDGFLDNYFFAMPILRKHGHNGVSFPVADRIEADDAPRAEAEDVLAGSAAIPPRVRNALVTTPQGFTVRKDVFLNRGEVRAMEKSGVFQVASHCMGHYGVFTGPEFTDFFRPRTRLRTFYRTAAEPVWGLPDFPVGPGLLHRAFIPDPELVRRVGQLVPQDFDGAARFFAGQGNVRALESLVRGFAARMGRFETETEQKDRMWREIGEGKALLESILGRKVRSLCWPWGRYSGAAHEMAVDAGFSVFFVVRGGANPPGEHLAVRRFESREMNAAWMAAQVTLHTIPFCARLLGKAGL